MTIAEIWRSSGAVSSSGSSDSELGSEPEAGPVTHVDLAELYHLAPGLPARGALLGRWSPRTGPDHWDRRSIYQRRQDFSGLTIRVGVTAVRDSLIVYRKL